MDMIHFVNNFPSIKDLLRSITIGGSRGACPAHAPPPPMGPILSFSHTFSPKSAHVGGPRPPQRVHPPREILDPLLITIFESFLSQKIKPSCGVKCMKTENEVRHKAI